MKVGTRVKVTTGRNAGQWGTIAAEIETCYYVDFNRMIAVNEGFGSMANYPDGYWVKKEFVEAEA